MAEASLQSKDALLSPARKGARERGEVLERGGRAEDGACDGARQQRDPSSRPAGERGESAHHFDIQLAPIVP